LVLLDAGIWDGLVTIAEESAEARHSEVSKLRIHNQPERHD